MAQRSSRTGSTRKASRARRTASPRAARCAARKRKIAELFPAEAAEFDEVAETGVVGVGREATSDPDGVLQAAHDLAEIQHAAGWVLMLIFSRE